MKKLLLFLIAFLLIAASFAVADDNGAENGDQDEIEVLESDDDVGDSLVEKPPKPPTPRRPIARLHLTGHGIAISESDPFDFMHAKLVIGAVKISKTSDDVNADEASEVDTNYVTRRLGVLMLDDQRYHLKDIAVSMDEISAAIYGPTTEADSNSPAIGELTVTRFEKPGKDIWAGNMVLNDKAYNVYFLGYKRQFKLTEIAQKIGGYCFDNPDDLRCKNVVAACATNKDRCRERIENYCEQNTTDLKCLQLKKLYCLKNVTDERCREYLEGLCEEKPRLPHCKITTENGEEVISINEDAVAEVTAEPGEPVRTLVKTKERSKLGIVANPVPVVARRSR